MIHVGMTGTLWYKSLRESVGLDQTRDRILRNKPVFKGEAGHWASS